MAKVKLIKYLEKRNPRLHKVVLGFEPKLEWEDLDHDCILDFKKYMLEENGYAPSTFKLHYTELKSICKRIRPEILPKIQGIRVKVDKPQYTYLNSEELKKIEKLRLHSPMKRNVRDKFLIGAYSGARFSDFINLSYENIQDGVLHYMTQKTGELIKVPAHPFVVEKLKKGIVEVSNYKTKESELATFDRAIKEICKEAKILDKGVYFQKRSGKASRVVRQKWQKVSSHTARRSFATNLSISGADVRDIQKMLGHSSIEMTERYIVGGSSERMEKLKSLDFFS